MEQPTEDKSVWLFGDDMKERLTEIRGDNSIRQEFLKKGSTFKRRTYGKEDNRSPSVKRSKPSGNEKPYQKSPGRSYQGYKRAQGYQKPVNKENWKGKGQQKQPYQKKKPAKKDHS